MSRPSCPNHGEPLEGIPFPMPSKGVGICPVSKCPFEFTSEGIDGKLKLDINGNLVKEVEWRVEGHD